jgi:nitrile hydratase
MSDVHDLGGRLGQGPILREPREPVFHARWEGRVLGLAYCAIGFGWINVDAFRHGIERMEPARYLAASYYERWLVSLERVLAEAGVLAAGFPEAPAAARPGFERAVGAPRFGVGDAVRARVRPGSATTELRSAARHTRLPGYASGRRGVVVSVRGGFVFPDTHAHGEGEQPQHLYTVRFSARELWGASAEPGASVSLDLFEPYLEAAPSAEAEGARNGA